MHKTNITILILILFAATQFAIAQQPAAQDPPAQKPEIQDPETSDAQPQQTEVTATAAQLLAACKMLSATTEVDGQGWEQYGNFLHTDFKRWSEGQSVWDRDRTISVIKQWWEAGNRVSKNVEEQISLQIVGNTGVVRKKISEFYVDKDGKATGDFKGFITQVWVFENDGWKILSSTIQKRKEPNPES